MKGESNGLMGISGPVIRGCDDREERLIDWVFIALGRDWTLISLTLADFAPKTDSLYLQRLMTPAYYRKCYLQFVFHQVLTFLNSSLISSS